MDHGIQPGNLYAYRVAAVDQAGNVSPYTSPVSVGLPGITLQLSTLTTGQDTVFSLGSILVDEDHSISELQIQISQENNVTADVQGGSLVITPSPIGYTGAASFTMRAEDPDGFFDLKAFSFNFSTGGGGNQFTVSVPDIRFAEDQSFDIFMDTTVTITNYPPSQVTWSFTPGPELDYTYDSQQGE